MSFFLRVFLGVLLVALIAVADQHVVTVNGEAITAEEYVYVARKAIAGRFFHGSVPEAEMQTFRRELLDELVDAYLLSGEARRRGLEGKVSVDGQGADRLAASAELRKQLVAQLKEQVMAVSEPSDSQVRSYYEAHLDKFVRPEQTDVSVILLRVDPSSGSAAWEKTQKKAAELKAEVIAGGSFEELAEIHSADVSASAGGAMGLLHRGLLGDGAEQALVGLAPGEISEPQFMLDGVALFRLNARIPEQQLLLEEVMPRARGLLSREEGELAWDSLLFRLRSNAEIILNEPLLQKVGG